MELIKIENKYLGTMYLDITEDNRIKLLDSNQEYVGYVCTYELEKDIQETINKLIEIKHISDIVDLGFCNNMCFGKSINDVLDEYDEFIENCDIDENEIEENKSILRKSLANYINIIGNNYFLVDYTEL